MEFDMGDANIQERLNHPSLDGQYYTVVAPDGIGTHKVMRLADMRQVDSFINPWDAISRCEELNEKERKRWGQTVN